MTTRSGPLTWTTRSPEETVEVARECARTWDDPRVVGLVGPLGAGKTTFLRGVVEARGGDPSRVRSPTFTLINEYEGTRPRVIHADLYRVGAGREQETVGLEDYFEDVLLMVEWADQWSRGWPSSALTMVMSHAGRDCRFLRLYRRPPDRCPAPGD